MLENVSHPTEVYMHMCTAKGMLAGGNVYIEDTP